MEKSIVIEGISSRIYLPETKINEIVVGVHGFAGDKESSVLIQLAKELNKQNKALISFDLPCHGENDNSKNLNLNECICSLKTIFKYVKQNYNGISVSVFATSFGGYLTLVYLSNNNECLNKVILRAPAIFMGDILENVILPEHNFSFFDLQKTVDLGYAKSLLIDDKFLLDLKNLSLEKENNINHFIYILQGRKDNVVNCDDNERFFNNHYPNKHKIIYFENADHRFKNVGELERIIKETLSILNEKKIKLYHNR